MSNLHIDIQMLHNKLTSLNIELQRDKYLAEEKLQNVKDKYDELIITIENTLLEG